MIKPTNSTNEILHPVDTIINPSFAHLVNRKQVIAIMNMKAKGFSNDEIMVRLKQEYDITLSTSRIAKIVARYRSVIPEIQKLNI